MSFSSEIKTELCALPAEGPSARACLLGLLLPLRQFERSVIALQTAHEDVCALLDTLLHRCFPGIVTELAPSPSGICSLSVPQEADRLRVLESFDLGVLRRLPDGAAEEDEEAGALLRGIFLTCGSITNPRREYHFELVIPFANLCADIRRFAAERGLPLRQTKRKGAFVLYLKESEHIEDMLTFMGAVRSSLELMNIKIYKDVRNKVNRVTNCETANIGKTVAAAARQLADITLIHERIGFEELPEDLRELAEIRLENPEMSLRELGAMLSEPISRSGVNHRLRRLGEIAEELRGGKRI